MTPEQAITEIVDEFARATGANSALHSAHEGYAVIAEELDELWDEIKKKRALRSRDELVKEARQVGAMAMRFMVDLL